MKTSEDIKTSLVDYSLLTTNRFISIGLSLVSAILLTRILGTGGYGKFNLFYLVANITFIVFINWTSASVLRFGKEQYVNENKINKVFWTRNILVCLGLIACIFVLLVIREKAEEYTHIRFVWIFVFAFLLVQILIDYMNYIFQATGKLKISSFVLIFPRFFFIISLLILFLLNKRGINSILLFFLLSQFLTFIIFLKWIDFELFFPISVDKEIFKEILIFSYPLIFSSLSAYIINYVDLFFIKRYFSISDVGTYSLSYNLMTSLQQIAMVVITVTTPILIGLYTEGREEIIGTYVEKVTPQGVFFWSIFLTISILVLPSIVPILFGEVFYTSVVPMQILMVGLVYNSLSCFYSGVLTTYKLIKKVVYVSITMAVFNLVGDMCLVPRIGVSGAAITSASVFSFGGIAYMHIGNKRLDLKEYKSLFFLAPVLTAFVGSFFKVNIIFLTAIIGLFYYLILAKLKLFSGREMQFLEYVDMPFFFKRILSNSYRLLYRI